MITFIINALKIIFVLGFLILIHEGGHFLVSRLCKVKVNEFSIGFGPKIWQKQGKETKYTLRLIPLGGYVNLEGEEEESEDERSFRKASIPKRMAIVLAGATVNIVFAIVIYFMLISITGNNSSLVVKETIPDLVAQQVGITVNDEIIKVNGKRVYTKSELDKKINDSNGEEITVTIKRNDEFIDFKLIPTAKAYKNTGIYLKAQNTGESTKIITVDSKSVAEYAGIKANDEILKINNKEVKNQTEITELINNIEEETLEFTLKRGNEEVIIDIKPEVKYQYYLGVYFNVAENNFTNNVHFALFETKDFVFSIFDNLKMLFTGEARIDQFVGPVGISEVVVNTNAVKDYVYILALISLSLGITNLLPIPALDGGKFVFLVIEAIRNKKMSERMEMNIQLVGFVLLIILSIYVTYNDILRIL